MSQEKKTMDLGQYIKQIRTNLVLNLEANKENILRTFDDLTARLYEAYGQIEILKTRLPKEDKKEVKKKKK